MRLFRSAMALALCIAVAVAAVFISPVAVSAESLTGVVTTVNDPLNVREKASSSSKLVGTVPRGEYLTVLDNSDPSWYLIEYGSGEGYIKGYASSTYIKIIANIVNDEDFEKHLTNQGFPESYKPYLRALHSLHPEWVFYAKKTGLNWSDVVTAQCEVGRSVTSKAYSIGSELSYEQGAYNWDTNSFVIHDSGGWVMASKELVEYCLDPRNYLTPSYSFAFKAMSYSQTETYEGVVQIIKGTFLDTTYPADKEDSASFATYTDAIISAARTAGISAYHLASYIVQEQGTNGTELTKGTMPGYEGFYNHLNIQAYQSGGLSAREMGARHAKNKGWNTPYKAILGGAQFIVNGYINVGQNTIYLKKFDLIATGGYYNHQYMSNIKAVFSEASKLQSAYSDMLDSPYEFEIPVFNNMPEQACAKPTSTGSNNNVMKLLAVDGYSLTPSFDKYVYDYGVMVGANVSSVNISAQAYDSTAKISGAGKVNLVDGDNAVKVVVTAASGTTRTYNINIHKEPGGNNPPPPAEPTINGSYSVGEFITGVQPGTTVADFITKLGVNNGDVTVQTSSGGAKSGTMATGDKVLIHQNGTLKLTYTVVIFADINGDGKISTVDLFMGQRHILGTYTITGANLKACDINRDGRVSTVDLFMGQRHILGTYTITQ